MTTAMNFMKSLMISVFAILCLLISLATSAPVEVRDVFVPRILYPHADTIWHVGQRHNVTWDISNAPQNITNRFGTIRLRKFPLGNDPQIILAQGFDILDARHVITVPDSPGSAVLVLYGDSGNFSPVFTIQS